MLAKSFLLPVSRNILKFFPGSSNGIGRAAARLFALEGAAGVTITGRNIAALEVSSALITAIAGGPQGGSGSGTQDESARPCRRPHRRCISPQTHRRYHPLLWATRHSSALPSTSSTYRSITRAQRAAVQTRHNLPVRWASSIRLTILTSSST